MKVSFVIPCYQEEAALAAFGPLLAEVPADEIIFVDDGSTDDTPGGLCDLAEADPRVRIETHATNQGVGAAMRTGIRASTGAVVVVYDVDRTYPLETARQLVAGIEAGADVVTATPYGAEQTWQDVPRWRRMLSGGAARAYRLVLGRRGGSLSCFTCAFRAYRGDRIRALRFRSDGFPAAAEMLGRLALAGAQIEERPAPLRARTEGMSKMRVGRATLGHLGTLIRLLGVRLVSRGPRA